MKLSKWLTPIFVGSLALTSVNLVGCSAEKKPEPTPPPPVDVEQFIYDRTFALLGKAVWRQDTRYSGFCWGTCWIVDDSTPDVYDDYKYYVATNMHVSHGNDFYVDNPDYYPIEYKYADSSLTDREDKILDSWNDYIKFTSCVRQDETDFQFDSPVEENYYIPCIDMMVYAVDFGSPQGTIKIKLDNLNSYSAKHHCINHFVDPTSQEILNKNKFVGGYPYREVQVTEEQWVYGGCWECETLQASELKLVAKEDTTDLEPIFGYPGHCIGQPDVDRDNNSLDWYWQAVGEDLEDSEQYYFADISAQYRCKTTRSADWMSGGASGSMLVTEDCEVCGIYWGGFGNFFPCFSLFNVDQNFISQWLRD